MNYVELETINEHRNVVVIREPGSQKNIRRIECSLEEAAEIYLQLGVLLNVTAQA